MCTLKRIVILCFILVSVSGYSAEIEVKDGNLKYRLKFGPDLIEYSDHEMTLSLIKRKCNSHIIEKFNKELEYFTKASFLNSSRPGFIQLKLNTIIGYEPRFGNRAIFFLSLNEKIKKFKIEEQLNCLKH